MITLKSKRFMSCASILTIVVDTRQIRAFYLVLLFLALIFHTCRLKKKNVVEQKPTCANKRAAIFISKTVIVSYKKQTMATRIKF